MGLTVLPALLKNIVPLCKYFVHHVHPVLPEHPVNPVHPVHPLQPVHPVYPLHPVHPLHPLHPVHPVLSAEFINITLFLSNGKLISKLYFSSTT